MPGCPSGQREQTVNLPAIAYGGSNPSPGTVFIVRADFGPLGRTDAGRPDLRRWGPNPTAAVVLSGPTSASLLDLGSWTARPSASLLDKT